MYMVGEGEWSVTDLTDMEHQDFPHDWAYVVYISDTNLESGTKMYKSLQDSIEDEITF